MWKSPSSASLPPRLAIQREGLADDCYYAMAARALQFQVFLRLHFFALTTKTLLSHALPVVFHKFCFHCRALVLQFFAPGTLRLEWDAK
jgi:hypothetical protein